MAGDGVIKIVNRVTLLQFVERNGSAHATGYYIDIMLSNPEPQITVIDVTGWLLAAPFILLIFLVGEIGKLKLSKTTLDRDAVFQRESKLCIGSYFLAAVLLVYRWIAGESLGYPLALVVCAVGTHMGAAIWKDNK